MLGSLECGEASFGYGGDITIDMKIGTAKFSFNKEEESLNELPYTVLNKAYEIEGPVQGDEIRTSYPTLYMHEFQPFISGWSMDTKTKDIKLVGIDEEGGDAGREEEFFSGFALRLENATPSFREALRDLGFGPTRSSALYRLTGPADYAQNPKDSPEVPLVVWKYLYSEEHAEAMRKYLQTIDREQLVSISKAQLSVLSRPKEMTPKFQVDFEGGGPRFRLQTKSKGKHLQNRELP